MVAQNKPSQMSNLSKNIDLPMPVGEWAGTLIRLITQGAHIDKEYRQGILSAATVLSDNRGSEFMTERFARELYAAKNDNLLNHPLYQVDGFSELCHEVDVLEFRVTEETEKQVIYSPNEIDDEGLEFLKASGIIKLYGLESFALGVAMSNHLKYYGRDVFPDNLEDFCFKLGDWVVSVVSQSELDEMIDDVDYADYAEGIEAGDWVVSDSEVIWKYDWTFGFEDQKSGDKEKDIFWLVLEDYLSEQKKMKESLIDFLFHCVFNANTMEQNSSKAFEPWLVAELRRLNIAKEVYVGNESHFSNLGINYCLSFGEEFMSMFATLSKLIKVRSDELEVVRAMVTRIAGQ